MNEKQAAPRRGRLGVRWFFFAAAVALVVGTILLSRTTRTEYRVGAPITIPPVPTQTPCPLSTELEKLCDGHPGYVKPSQPYPVHPLSFRVSWIVFGVAGGLIVAGVGLAIDRR